MFLTMLHKAAEGGGNGIAYCIGTGEETRHGLVEKLIGHTIFHIALLLKQTSDGEKAAHLRQLAFVRYPTESLGGCIGQVLEKVHRREFSNLDRGHGVYPYVGNLGQEGFDRLEQTGQYLALTDGFLS